MPKSCRNSRRVRREERKETDSPKRAKETATVEQVTYVVLYQTTFGAN